LFFQELYPGFAAEKVSGHRPQIMFSGHVKRGLDPTDVVDSLMTRGYRALLNIQEASEPEYLDLEAASTSKGLVYVHIPVPYVEAEEGEMYEDRFTLELARQIGLVMLALPRPLMIVSTTAKRASAVWFFDYAVKMNLSSAQVMMLTASAGLGFASDPPLLYWVARFMMMVDTELARNRRVFGDLKFDVDNEDQTWDPNAKDGGSSPEISRSPSKNSFSDDPISTTLVTGPDGKRQTYGDSLTGWSLAAPCPFSNVAFPGFIDAKLGGMGRGDSGPQITFGRFRMGGFAKFKAANWLVNRDYRSVINLGHPEDIDFIDIGNHSRELGLEYMHIPVEEADITTNNYSLNLARIIALSILGMPKPLMIVSGGMKRASAAWIFAHATRWELGSTEVKNLSLSSELNFTLAPKLHAWVEKFMEVADAAIMRGEKVLGDIAISGHNIPQWHLDLSASTYSHTMQRSVSV
jgi:protein tyrosine phosphatase (PTP) superfamily phosphohydrolase (DUF442 family)